MQIDYGVTWDYLPDLVTARICHAFARAFHHQAGKGTFSEESSDRPTWVRFAVRNGAELTTFGG
jgi:hypothetical protein